MLQSTITYTFYRFYSTLIKDPTAKAQVLPVPFYDYAIKWLYGEVEIMGMDIPCITEGFKKPHT